ncbi:MAG: hypothetical protein V4805_00085 [Pseudomonadota bacterium]
MSWLIRVGKITDDPNEMKSASLAQCVITTSASHVTAHLLTSPDRRSISSGRHRGKSKDQAEIVWKQVLATLVGV